MSWMMEKAQVQVEDENENVRPGNCCNEEIKEEMKDFTGNTTLHGMKQATDQGSHPVRRFIWSVLLMASFSCFMFLCVIQLRLYYIYPTATRLTLKTERPLEFPSITICNINKFRKSVAAKNNISALVLRDNFMVMNGHPSRVNWSSPEIKQWTESQDMYDFASEARHNMSMFWQCIWKSQFIPCEDYFTSTVTDEGLCYTFHSEEFIKTNGTLKVYQTGSDHGLKIRGSIDQDEYYYGTAASAGLKILAHDPKHKPLVKEMGITVEPGAESYITLRKVKVVRLPPPYQDGFCTDTDAATFRNPLKYETFYSTSSCKSECAMNFTYKKCGCIMSSQKVAEGIGAVCNMEQVSKCALPALEEYARSDGEIKACNCFAPCNDVGYTMSVASAQTPAKHLQGDLINMYKADLNWFRENLFDLRIYYEKLNYDITEEVPAYELSAFGGDVGGFIGLFLGASVLTLFEFVEFVLRSFRWCVRQPKTMIKQATPPS